MAFSLYEWVNYLQGDDSDGQVHQLDLFYRHSFHTGYFSFGWAPNMLYCDISSLQPMEIYVDDEAKLTLHGLVQVGFYIHSIVFGLLSNI